MKTWKRKVIAFLFSQGISLFGSSIVQFAIVWYVTLQSSSGVWVSALTICSFLPQFLISPFAGVWADRFPRKYLIIFSDMGIAIVTLILICGMPYIKEDMTLMSILLLVSGIRSLGTGIQTPVVNAMIPQLVPKEHLMRFNGINATMQSIVQFGAPAVAGAVLTFGTLRESLFIDIITAVIGIAILATISIQNLTEKKISEQVSLRKEMKAGLTYAGQHPFIGKLLCTYGSFIFFAVPAGFLATLFVSRTYGASYFYLSLVEIVGFIGMTAGGMLIGVWGGFQSKIKTLLVGMLLFGALAIGMGIVPYFSLYLCLMGIYGIGLTMVQTAITTLLQEKTEEAMQGRIFGFMGMLYSGCLPLGMLIFGPLADMISMKLLMVISGGLLLVLTLVLRLDCRFCKAE